MVCNTVISLVLDDPIVVDFHLEDNDKTHIKRTAYTRHVSDSHIGTEFECSKRGDPQIASYILSHR